MHLKKITAVLLAGLMFIPQLTSCGKNDADQTEATVSVESDAANGEVLGETEDKAAKGDSLGQFYAIEEITSSRINPMGTLAEGWENGYDSQMFRVNPLVYKDRYLITPCYTGDWSDLVFMSVDIYDFQTQETQNIEIARMNDLYYIIPFECNDSLYVCMRPTNYDYPECLFYEISLSDDLSKTDVIQSADFNDYTIDVSEEDAFFSRVLDILSYDDQTILVIGDEYEDFNTDYLNIYTNIEEPNCQVINWDCRNVVFDQQLPYVEYDNSIPYIGMFRTDDGPVIVSDDAAYSISADNKLKEYPLRTADIDRVSLNASSGYYVNTLEGLFYVDGKSNEKRLLDYNCVIGDPMLLYYGTFICERDGVFYFVSDTFPMGYEESLDLTEEDSLAMNRHIFAVKPVDNPYAGRTVLDLVSSVNDIDLMRNIYKFNSDNDEYYIRLTLLDGSVPGSCIEENVSHDLPFIYYNTANSYCNYIYRLAQCEKIWKAYVAKNKPDLLYGMPLEEGMCNEQYCLPLQDLIDTGDGLYTNIIDEDKSAHDGQLFRMPLTFTYSCLTHDLWRGLDVENILDKTKLTFEEYDAFKGNDLSFFVSTYGYEGFIWMFSNEFDQYVSMRDKTSALDQAEFKNMASYFLKWKQEDSVDPFDLDYEINDSLIQVNCNSILSLFSHADDTLIFRSDVWALPSNSGRGYGAEINSAVAICALTDSKDGAAGVVRFLMSANTVLPADRLALSINREKNSYINSSYKSVMSSIDESNIDTYYEDLNKNIESIDHICLSDHIIFDSVLRYMPEYISGSLSLSDYSQATKTVTDKALSER